MRVIRLRRFIIAALFALMLSAPFLAHAQGQTHVVAPGETLFRIALQHGLTVEALAAANGITDPTRIYVGQVLVIPGPNQSQPAQPAANDNPAPANNAPVYYTVQPGDTLNIIAQKFGVSWVDLAKANNIADPNHIVPGQQLVIPGATSPGTSATVPDVQNNPPAAVAPPTAVPTSQPAAASVPSGPRTHVVQPGEGLAAIGRKYGVEWSAIAGANNITDPNRIYAGMVLQIPYGDVNPTTMAPSVGVPPGPIPPSTSGKSITVKLSQQRTYAYENGVLVRNVLVSTGLPGTPTVQGDYRIYVKYKAQLMTGPGYYLPGVPWVMYFYQGYSFHGTYWHNNFGRPMSHGCVNMPTEEALWLFNWAEVGTPVHVEW